MGFLKTAGGFALGGLPGALGINLGGDKVDKAASNAKDQISGFFGGLGGDKGAKQGLRNEGRRGTEISETGAGRFFDTRRQNELLDQLRGVTRGEDSIAQEQLRQGLQQQLAMQQSMAASAAPQNAAAAARNAMVQGGRAASGLAGQSALAGIQERRAAMGTLGNMLNQMRGQDLQAMLGGQRNAISAHGGILGQPTKEQMLMSGGTSMLPILFG